MLGLSPFGLLPYGVANWTDNSEEVIGQTFATTIATSSQSINASAINLAQSVNVSVNDAQQLSMQSALVVSETSAIVVAPAIGDSYTIDVVCGLTQNVIIGAQSLTSSQGGVVVAINSTVLVPQMFGESAGETILVTLSSPDRQTISVPAITQIAETSIFSIYVSQSVVVQSSEQQSVASSIFATITSSNQVTAPDIELNPRRISLALTTERPRIYRTTQLYSLELTTPRYQITRG